MRSKQLYFSLEADMPPSRCDRRLPIQDELAAFREFGQPTRLETTRCSLPSGETVSIPTYINEFWTAKQRAVNRLHEISYRACFKAQLPRFFIERLTRTGDIVYDPFMGRGTTPLEAALLGRIPYGCDINPLSQALAGPRLNPPELQDVAKRLKQINFRTSVTAPSDLLVFFHADTLQEIAALRQYLIKRRDSRSMDLVDHWICLVALNRLTGHSPGFFSVYTLPPNQAVSVKSQRRINERRKQTPPRRIVPDIIYKKSRYLLSECGTLERRILAGVTTQARLVTGPADCTPEIPDGSVSLVVTSPPFLNVVSYATDNWLRCWFMDIDASQVKLTVPRSLDRWQEYMTRVFGEASRILKPNGHIAFEVGEVHKGKTRLEEVVIPCGIAAGLSPQLVLINDQEFTKTANCWGVENNKKGTNTNRIVLFRKS